jgi:putative transposase
MKKSRFSEQQIAFVLRQAEEGTPIAEVCLKAGISEASFCAWRKVYGAAAVRDEAAKAARGGKPASEEVSRRPVAGQRDAAGRDPPENMKPARKREMVDDIRRALQVSIRRACQALPVDLSLPAQTLRAGCPMKLNFPAPSGPRLGASPTARQTSGTADYSRAVPSAAAPSAPNRTPAAAASKVISPERSTVGHPGNTAFQTPATTPSAPRRQSCGSAAADDPPALGARSSYR